MTNDEARGAHDASASAAGYLFQCRYALLLGLKAISARPELHLSIEKFDDVAFVQGDSPIKQVQTKHHVGRKGSLSDASEDLWRTLLIWSKQVLEDSDVPFRTDFVLLTTGLAPEGSAAEFLRLRDRDEEKARSLLLTTAGKSRSAKNKPGYDAFRSLSETAQLNLLRATHIADGSPNIVDLWDDICQAVRLAAPREHTETFAERLEGWWFGVVVRLLVSGGTVPVLVIDSKLDELREEFSRASLPVDYGHVDPSASVVAALDQRPFVDQLRRVEIGDRRVEWAIRDYYRASEQRSKWARERLLVDGEVERYERELIEAWQPRFAAMVDGLPRPCDDRAKVTSGQRLYQWAEVDALFPLRSVNQRFLTHGSFHILANRFAIGWHPDFEHKATGNEEGKEP